MLAFFQDVEPDQVTSFADCIWMQHQVVGQEKTLMPRERPVDLGNEHGCFDSERFVVVAIRLMPIIKVEHRCNDISPGSRFCPAEFFTDDTIRSFDRASQKVEMLGVPLIENAPRFFFAAMAGDSCRA